MNQNLESCTRINEHDILLERNNQMKENLKSAGDTNVTIE